MVFDVLKKTQAQSIILFVIFSSLMLTASRLKVYAFVRRMRAFGGRISMLLIDVLVLSVCVDCLVLINDY